MPLRTSQKPWTAEFDTYFTYIRDANGDKIGKFNDYRDADSVVELQNEIKRLEEQIEEMDRMQADEIGRLDVKIAELEEVVGEKCKEVDDLKFRLEESKETL